MSKAERTRQFIIEKTAPVFNAKGFAGTSIQDLMEATGLSKGSIYGNFDNKDDVALAAFDHNFGKVISYLREKVQAKENAVDRLLVYPAVYRSYLGAPFLRSGCPLLNTAVEADDTHPLLKEKAADALAFMKEAVIRQVKRGIERKEIRKNANPTEVAVLIITMIEGAIMQAKLTNRNTELRIAMDFLENYIEGLRP